MFVFGGYPASVPLLPGVCESGLPPIPSNLNTLATTGCNPKSDTPRRKSQTQSPISRKTLRALRALSTKALKPELLEPLGSSGTLGGWRRRGLQATCLGRVIGLFWESGSIILAPWFRGGFGLVCCASGCSVPTFTPKQPLPIQVDHPHSTRGSSILLSERTAQPGFQECSPASL